jgi:hypothetical protein
MVPALPTVVVSSIAVLLGPQSWHKVLRASQHWKQSAMRGIGHRYAAVQCWCQGSPVPGDDLCAPSLADLCGTHRDRALETILYLHSHDALLPVSNTHWVYITWGIGSTDMSALQLYPGHEADLAMVVSARRGRAREAWEPADHVQGVKKWLCSIFGRDQW